MCTANRIKKGEKLFVFVRFKMPTMAMESSMDSAYWRQWTGEAAPSFSASHRGLRERKAFEAAERERALRDSLIARANAAAALGHLMAEQNQKMLAGLYASSRQHTQKVDFIARNMKAVGPNRSLIGPRQARLLAQGEAMAAATAHLGPPTSTHAPREARSSPPVAPPDASDDLMRAAWEEVQRGQQISAFERSSRRPARLR